jgi:mxaL protein
LVFLTDGQETPPQTLRTQFDGKPGEVGGLIAGVGGANPVTVPRYDREDQFIGYWENADIEKPPVSTTVYSEKVETRILPREGPYLSWLDEGHLKALSASTGLGYHRLTDPEQFADALLSPRLAEHRAAETDMRPLLGLAALVILALAYGFEGKLMRKGNEPCP